MFSSNDGESKSVKCWLEVLGVEVRSFNGTKTDFIELARSLCRRRLLTKTNFAPLERYWKQVLATESVRLSNPATLAEIDNRSASLHY
jgi:hypothetical protein